METHRNSTEKHGQVSNAIHVYSTGKFVKNYTPTSLGAGLSGANSKKEDNGIENGGRRKREHLVGHFNQIPSIL